MRVRFWLFGLLLGSSLIGCQRPTESFWRGSEAPKLYPAHIETADGAVLPLEASVWPSGRDPKAILLALHGFNDYRRAFVHLAEPLKDRGILLMAYDQRGFGGSPQTGRWAGSEVYAADLRTILLAIHRRYPSVPLFVLGESMGAAIVIKGLKGRPLRGLKGVILSAPALWSRDTMPWYQSSLLAVAAGLLPELTLTGRGLGIQASDNRAMLSALGRDPWVIKATRVDAMAGLTDLMDEAQMSLGALEVPTLVLYGLRDPIIPWVPVVRALRTAQGVPLLRLAIYPEGYHLLLRDLGRSKPLQDVLAFIEDPKASLPSGCEQAVLDLKEDVFPREGPNGPDDPDRRLPRGPEE